MTKATVTLRCTFSGCLETAHYEFSTRTEAHEFSERRRESYRCIRHYAPDEVLSPNTLSRRMEFIAGTSKKYPQLKELFWGDGSGFVYGPGFKAWANDFPSGTKLIIEARIELPEENTT